MRRRVPFPDAARRSQPASSPRKAGSGLSFDNIHTFHI